MKKIDIRVIGKTEIDMNTLTDVARERIDQLLSAHVMLTDKKEILWRNNRNEIVEFGGGIIITSNNDKELREVRNEINMIEYEIIDIIKDKSNFKGFSLGKLGKFINPILNSKWFDLVMTGTWFYLYIDACYDQNILGALCDGCLVVYNALNFYTKLYVERLLK